MKDEIMTSCNYEINRFKIEQKSSFQAIKDDLYAKVDKNQAYFKLQLDSFILNEKQDLNKALAQLESRTEDNLIQNQSKLEGLKQVLEENLSAEEAKGGNLGKLLIGI